MTPLSPVHVATVELVRLRLPLVLAFRTSFGVQHERDALLVRVVTDAGAVGWGECVTPAAPVYSEEFTDGAALVLRDHLVPRLLAGGRMLGGEHVAARLEGVRGHRMARAALEVAVLDAQLRTAGRSLATHLGAVRSHVPAGVSVGIPDGGVPELLELVDGYLTAGYRRVKAKVAPATDVVPMQALRDHVGSRVSLQVDGNGAYDPTEPEHAKALDGLDELGLSQIEQPFAAGRLLDHARLASRLRTPICLDESLHDAGATVDALDMGACSIVNIKAGRVGGVLESVAIHDLCRDRDVPVWCGGMLETGIGRAVNVALAALPGFLLPGDVSASDRYFAQDLTEPFRLEDGGRIAVPAEPGIGRAPSPGPLATASTVRIDGESHAGR